MKAFWQGLWMATCVAGTGVAGASFGLQYNLLGAAILGALGLALGAALAHANPLKVLHGLLQVLS